MRSDFLQLAAVLKNDPSVASAQIERSLHFCSSCDTVLMAYYFLLLLECGFFEIVQVWDVYGEFFERLFNFGCHGQLLLHIEDELFLLYESGGSFDPTLN